MTTRKFYPGDLVKYISMAPDALALHSIIALVISVNRDHFRIMYCNNLWKRAGTYSGLIPVQRAGRAWRHL